MNGVARFIWLVGLLAASGCCQPQRPYCEPCRAAIGNAALDGANVLAIARKAVAEKEDWVDHAEFQSPTRHEDGSWSLIVWRLPKVPGGHRWIKIDKAGEVIQYERGL